jgi:uncharacterized protein (TIGR02266 family)
MTQDTRKDRRVKIVSLNVRYKSATVDEFIENHALDVSRGGIYVKTGSPFPPGTLLKFEIRLASDQAVITGVGRVVWKRDGNQGTGDRPAGMGVKFIKIDDPSRALIDKLLNARADAGQAFESEPEALPPPAGRKPIQTPTGVHAATRVGSPTGPSVGKGTIVGLGIPGPAASTAPPAQTSVPRSPSAPPRPNPSAGMFPAKSRFTSSIPPKAEQTVMKQAAELLEEALREAGGSMADVGTNPLFAGPGESRAPSGPPAAQPAVPPGESSAVVAQPVAQPSSAPEAAPTPPRDDAAGARAMVAAMSPAPVQAHSGQSGATLIIREPLPNVRADSQASRSSGRPTLASSRPRSIAGPPEDDDLKPAGMGGAGKWLWLVAAATAALAAVLFRDTLFGSQASDNPSSSSSPAASVAAPGVTLPASAQAAIAVAPSTSSIGVTPVPDGGNASASVAEASASADSPAPAAQRPVAPVQVRPAIPSYAAPRSALPVAAPAVRPIATTLTTTGPTNTAQAAPSLWVHGAASPSATTGTAPSATSSASGSPAPKATSSASSSDENPYTF